MASSSTTAAAVSTIRLSETEPLTEESKELLRQSATKIFKHLQEKSIQLHTSDPTRIKSWIRPDASVEYLRGRSRQCHYFDTYGFTTLPKFCTPEEIQNLKEEMLSMVNRDWNPGSEEEQSTEVFGTDSTSNSNRGDYFLDSANRVSFFAEPHAMIQQGGSSSNKFVLKESYRTNKIGALNKAGHGMHLLPETAFHKYTTSDKVRQLVLDLGWIEPVVPQSMYIFKQPAVGGTVHSHQDSSFLYTTPKQSCLGLWLALDDATLENGCLWVRPQSHHENVRRQFARNPEYDFDNPAKNGPTTKKLIFIDPTKEGGGEEENKKNDSSTSTLTVARTTKEAITWEGGLPESVDLYNTEHKTDDEDVVVRFDSFVPVEVRAGDLVVFCGTLDHFSLPNFSIKERHTFQLHLVDSHHVEWSPSNWLQYPSNQTFMKL
jgi:phytanoyl-CoA hydroxylase